MAPKIFLENSTGGTGYIGGTVLDTLVKSHPEYEITALLRNPPETFAQLYPNVRVIRGDYDSQDIISDAASKSDIVVHNGDSDHEPSINALIDGLLKSASTSYLIHLSGTGIVADWRDSTYLGRRNPRVWSDVDDIDEITTRPDAELHRNVDKIIQQAARGHGDKLKTGIICPPDIYGPGRGPGKKCSVYFPVFCSDIQKLGSPFYGGDGTNTKSWVHIEDLMQVYLNLVEAAVAGGGNADWGIDGYYFASTQEHAQIDIAKKTGEILSEHGLCKNGQPVAIPLKQIDEEMMTGWGYPHIGTYMFASNSRTRADRAAKKLGFKPKAPTLFESLEAELLAVAKQSFRR